KAPMSQLPGGKETAIECSAEGRMGAPADTAMKTTTSDESPVNTSNHPSSAGLGPMRRWRLMKIGMLSASVVVSRSRAKNAPSPLAVETPSDAGRMKMTKNSIIGILQLSERMTGTTSQSPTRRGGSAEPHRNRASAADRKAGRGCRLEPIV